MKKNVFGRKLSRDKNERHALFTSLMSALVMKERIITTEAKAKAIRADVEKLVTKAKEGSNAAKLILKKGLSQAAFDKILNEIAPRFANKQGGYVRLIKSGRRFGDDAPTVVMEWTEVASAIVPAQAVKVKPSTSTHSAEASRVKKASEGQGKSKAKRVVRKVAPKKKVAAKKSK
ncbi:MAG TPA: 50S ribosomal protein L17 [Patescibacteria group bacterium]|jgi:large subunit ribosomal protein L17|nr:50S ribosomal protein L17 [Patescibacteria group bacterium]